MPKLSGKHLVGVRSLLQSVEFLVGAKTLKRSLIRIAAIRLFALTLDATSLASLAALTAWIASIATSDSQDGTASFSFGEAQIAPEYGPILAISVVVLYFLKSGAVAFSEFYSARTLAKLEATLAINLVSPSLRNRFVRFGNEERAQGILLESTGAGTAVLSGLIALASEALILMIIFVALFLVSPSATVMLLLGFFIVSIGINLSLPRMIRAESKAMHLGLLASLRQASDIFRFRSELFHKPFRQDWLDEFFLQRSRLANSNLRIHALSSMPRLVLETALVLGALAYISLVVVFSDIQSQAGSLGVFVAAGLRVLGSLLPVQSSFNSIVSGEERARPMVSMTDELASLEQQATKLSVRNHENETQRADFSSISFKNLSVQESGRQILAPISGEFIGPGINLVAGKSGSGKTTLLRTLAGLTVNYSGDLLIGNKTIRECADSFSTELQMVEAEPKVVSGTIRRNLLLFSQKNHNEKILKSVMESLGVGYLIRHLEEEGFRVEDLSYGEKKRIALARATLSEAKVLLLDEPTSNLDSNTEELVTRHLIAASSNRLIIVASHSPTLIQSSQTVLNIEPDEEKI